MAQPTFTGGMRQVGAPQKVFQQVAQPPSNSGCVIDELESSFRACIAPLVADDASVGVTFQDEQRPSVELAINEFVELIRKTEAYFQKQRATIAVKYPELVLQEDIDELEVELRRKDDVLQTHMEKLKQWQSTLKGMQENSGSSSARTPAVQSLGATIK